MGFEDLGLFSLDVQIPAMMFRLGAADPAKLAHALETSGPLPGPHSPLFAPVYAPTIKTGVTAMTAVALDVLKHQPSAHLAGSTSAPYTTCLLPYSSGGLAGPSIR